MKHATLLAAAALVLLANALALIHAARNRSGLAEAEITLTDLELTYHRGRDDSGVSLRLRWADAFALSYSPELTQEELNPVLRLDSAKLKTLGFDLRMDLADPKAHRFYGGQAARTGFAALEYDGAAWQAWERLSRKSSLAYRAPSGSEVIGERERAASSRLIVIDAARDAASLRSRYPDRGKVLILPAIIRVALVSPYRPGSAKPVRPVMLTGHVQEIPSQIHVPRPLSDGFRALRNTSREPGSEAPLYRVRLRYGSLLEPWVVGVEF